MPDEQSNLNTPAAARRPAGSHRRGRRGGRGRSRSPRPALAKPDAPGDISPAPEPLEPAAGHTEAVENEADDTGGFREPHAEEPAEFAAPAGEPPVVPAEEPAAETPAAAPAPPREFPPERRPDRRPEPPRPRPWVKPADFRPAETSAISQAVAHATEVAESLKQMMDRLDEVLELVEVAERQKLADEREIEELHRALRRIQPPRREPPPQQPPRAPRRDEPRRDFRGQSQRSDEPPAPREPEPPRDTPNPGE